MAAVMSSSLVAALAAVLLLLLVTVTADEGALQHDEDDCKVEIGAAEATKCRDRLAAEGGFLCPVDVWVFIKPRTVNSRGGLVRWNPSRECCGAVLKLEKEAKQCWCRYLSHREQEIRTNKKELIHYCTDLLKPPQVARAVNSISGSETPHKF